MSSANEAIVIEAKLTSNNIPFVVLISKTSPYFGSESNNPVSGAIVSVRAENGKEKYFTESEPGVYILNKTFSFAGRWYIVDVEYDGITYSARSYLNEAVPIIDLGFSYFDGLGFFESGYNVSTYIRDPVDQENYYRLKFYINGIESNTDGEISLYTDELINGKEIGLGQRTLVLNESDTLTVELQSIDKAAYDYFYTLETISKTDWQLNVSPANPISNFNNGALGYFSAYSYSQKTVYVKDYIRK